MSVFLDTLTSFASLILDIAIKKSSRALYELALAGRQGKRYGCFQIRQDDPCHFVKGYSDAKSVPSLLSPDSVPTPIHWYLYKFLASGGSVLASSWDGALAITGGNGTLGISNGYTPVVTNG